MHKKNVINLLYIMFVSLGYPNDNLDILSVLIVTIEQLDI